jgi:hypothetical protein
VVRERSGSPPGTTDRLVASHVTAVFKANAASAGLPERADVVQQEVLDIHAPRFVAVVRGVQHFLG